MIIKFQSYINEAFDEIGIPILEFDPSIAEDAKNFKTNVKYHALDANIALKQKLLGKLQGQKIKIKEHDNKFVIRSMTSGYPEIIFRGEDNIRCDINSYEFCDNPNSFITVYPKIRIYTKEDPYGEEDWENESFINESYKEFNKKIDYEIISTLTKDEFENITFKYLNEHYTGWVILENLDRYIIHIVKWKSRDIFVHDGHYINSDFRKNDPQVFNSHKNYYNNIHKIKIKGIRLNQKFSECDPYGEEDWDD